MLTVQKTKDLLNGLRDSFPEAKINMTDEQEGQKIGLVVQEINKDQLYELANMVNDMDTHVRLKRSGTGISIHFN